MAIPSRTIVFDELADPSRRSILEFLRTGEKSVTELARHTGLKQPNLSNHLARMRDRGIVAAQRSGRQQIYHLADPVVEEMLAAVLSAGHARREGLITGAETAAWASGYLKALLSADMAAATRIVSDCVTRGLPLESLYGDVFEPALIRVGEMQSTGVLTVAQEHFLTAATDRLMARASSFYPSRPAGQNRAVLGCVAGNQHSVGVRMIADILAHAGWETVYLGANVPTESFAEMVVERTPDAVFVSCAQENSAVEVKSLVGRLRDLRERTASALRIGIGGGWINEHPELVEVSGADFTARDLHGLADLMEGWGAGSR